jgi:hypothetical protein
MAKAKWPMTKTISPSLGLVLSLIIGIVMGVATLFIQKATSVPAIYYLERVVIIFILPGLLTAMAVGGNIHAFAFWPAVAVNGLLYFVVAWLILRLFCRKKQRQNGRDI